MGFVSYQFDINDIKLYSFSNSKIVNPLSAQDFDLLNSEEQPQIPATAGKLSTTAAAATFAQDDRLF